MLVDNVEIIVRAGNGGNGLASFRREKYLPFGGPDGGDGGKGGNVIIESDADIKDMAVFRNKKVYKARDGGSGGKNKKHGLNAQHMVIKVPVGTTALVEKEGLVVQRADLRHNKQRVIVAKGGRGGKGNVHFATATRKAPRDFQPGEKGEECTIKLEMKLMIDAGIVGLPGSGKSTLLGAVSSAAPQTAEYDFTTREPVLGIVDDGRDRYVWSEMPAVVEGSCRGKGLGNSFLKHLSRAKVIVYLLDASSREPEKELHCLKNELEMFQPGFAMKRYVVVLNKMDILCNADEKEKIINRLGEKDMKVLPVSAKERSGLEELVTVVHGLIADGTSFASEETEPEIIFRPRPVDRKG